MYEDRESLGTPIKPVGTNFTFADLTKHEVDRNVKIPQPHTGPNPCAYTTITFIVCSAPTVYHITPYGAQTSQEQSTCMKTD